MRHVLLAVSCATVLISAPLSSALAGGRTQAKPGQDSAEVHRLKDKLELLQGKYELLQKENELLKKEIELLKKEGGKKEPGAASLDAPKATVNGIDYVVEKAVRSGNTVTLMIAATNTRADRVVAFAFVEGFDADGRNYKTKIRDAAKPFSLAPPSIRLLEGIKTKLQISINDVPSRVTELVRVEIFTAPPLSGLLDREPIRFGKISISK